MNSQPGYLAATRSFPLSLRVLAWLCLCVLSAGLLSGCARMKQYSLDSWQGPLPMHDLKYVEADP